MFLRNVSSYKSQRESYPRMQHFSLLQPWKHKTNPAGRQCTDIICIIYIYIYI
jgi:hypothetical protein